MIGPRHWIAGTLTVAALGCATPGILKAQRSASNPDPPERILVSKGVFEGHTARPLRYTPDGTDFVITNGPEFFNRPLYCMNTAFRVDCGDKPEFSLYLPGRGGNLRFGIKTPAGVKWLNDAEQVVARYRPGSMVYDIRDSLIGSGTLGLTVLPQSEVKGIIARVELSGTIQAIELIVAFGGANGERFARNGDIGCMPQPVSEAFQLRPEQCRGDVYTIATNRFVVRSPRVTLAGTLPKQAKLSLAYATKWRSLAELLLSSGQTDSPQVLLAEVPFQAGDTQYLVLTQESNDKDAASPVFDPESLPLLFDKAEQRRKSVAERVVVETPDEFINAAVAALNVASDGIWDEATGTYMHGAVAWRNKLLGWRGPYTADALGWHDRARRHFTYWAGQQITAPVPDSIPPADPTSNLSRNEPALHTNGALSKSHYDMNLVYIDALFRHFLWTGNLEFAQQEWPVIERHLEWERRLFRREFGPDRLPLYEAYAAIWASDDMDYDGGGATHATAYNYWHNKMAARMAKLLGKDATPYEHEAELIREAMQKYLWLPDCGWFAEWKDYLGLQLVHPNPGLWTIYHAIDSEAATPKEAWQMTRFVDTQIAHIPIHGPGVPEGNYFTLPTTSWMPYTWSLNNVVMAEVAHTSLAYWEANRPDEAFRMFKGCVLDSMYLGLCPGNVGMTTYFDMARGESQRDFADAVGVCSRTMVEGLFGVHPDALAGELLVRPGFPADWDHATIRHPDFNFSFHREGLKETFSIEPEFSKPMALRLQIPALRDNVSNITVNGQPAKWRALEDSVALPRIEIQAPATTKYEVAIQWEGDRPDVVTGPADSRPGSRTEFSKMTQGGLAWWEPLTVKIQPTKIQPAEKATNEGIIDWNEKMPETTRWDEVDLSSLFNDKVTQIFRNKYLSPRSPFCSLALPEQGIGSWCHFQERFDVDDSGLRSVAAANGGKLVLPNGVPFQTPGDAVARNIVFTSQWDDYPDAVTVPLNGQAKHIFLLVAGSSNPMQSRFDNGEVIVTYADGSTARLALHNPTTWWPIDQDYFIDDYAFKRPEPIPPRVDLKTGRIRLLNVETFKGRGGKVPGGAATVLDLPLAPEKELKLLTVGALANEVVVGLMAVTLER